MGAGLERQLVREQLQAAPVSTLIELLDQLADVILVTPPEVYTSRIDPPVSGTVGAHVRHALDHIATFASADGTTLCYDHRERGTAVEADPSAALRQMLRLKAALGRWMDRSADDPLPVRSLVAADGREVTAWSSFGRELAFVVSHTVHHQALIALLLAWHGLVVPPGFGIAPSTPHR
jgi:uncharacterized damage-inducible protein DinB